jgi:hypothetical protein
MDSAAVSSETLQSESPRADALDHIEVSAGGGTIVFYARKARDAMPPAASSSPSTSGRTTAARPSPGHAGKRKARQETKKMSPPLISKKAYNMKPILPPQPKVATEVGFTADMLDHIRVDSRGGKLVFSSSRRIVKRKSPSPSMPSPVKHSPAKPAPTKCADSPGASKKRSRVDDADRKRQARCGECDGCTRQDCGQCKNCLDKPKFGGEGRSKQACMRRRCEAIWNSKKTVQDEDIWNALCERCNEVCAICILCVCTFAAARDICFCCR